MKIYKKINEYLNNRLYLNDNFIDNLKKELSKYNSDEELLRSGGLPIELLDRLAHGFSEDDIKTIHPNNLQIKWYNDLNNVKWEIEKSGLTKKDWAKKINLSEPIDVSYEDGEFFIEDGHHRYMAAKILNKELNVDLKIKTNPIKTISPSMDYDEFHRFIFKKYKND